MRNKSTVPVAVVEQRGPSVVVQWERRARDGGATLCRTIVPADVVADGAVSAVDLRAGMAASVDWAAEYQPTLTGERVAAEMAALDIWTADDLRLNALKAQRAVTRVAVESLYDMLRRLGG